MTWEGRIIAEFEPGHHQSEPSLLALVSRLSHQQREHWPMLRSGLAALEQAETRRLELPGSNGSYVIVQHNPARIRSTSAAVDKHSIQARPCFLCPENLPPEEMGLSYGPDLVITCNPFPVLSRHLSIIDRRHVPQTIDGRVDRLLSLARDLGSDYFTLYNGPACGASAPDHFHLQACARGGLPIEHDLRSFGEIPRGDPVLIPNCGRSVVVFQHGDPDKLGDSLYGVLAGLGRGAAAAADLESLEPVKRPAVEPMINIIATWDPDGSESGLWTVYLFPRSRHRPACFFAPEPDKLTVSPGAIDMAGVIVVPNHHDFERITADQIAAIYAEVSLDRDTVRSAIS
jgi:hypothetical protein